MKTKIKCSLIGLVVLSAFATFFLATDSNKQSASQQQDFKHLSLSAEDLKGSTQSFIKALFTEQSFDRSSLSQTLQQHTEPTQISAITVSQNKTKSYAIEGLGCAAALQNLGQAIGNQKIDAIKIEFLQDSDPLRNTSFYATPQEFQTLYRGHRVITELTPATLQNSIHAATQYLLEHIQDNGKFDYIFDPTTGKIPKKYNLVRHAGTLYALMDVYEHEPNEILLKKVQLGIGYLLKNTKPCPEDGTAICVIDSNKVKLGANALALVALAKYTQVTGDQQHLTVMQKLANAIVRMQEANGHFISDWDLKTWQTTGFVSEYYPGEATLGLVELYKVDPNPLWLSTARKATDYIALTRDKNLTAKKITHDHWMLIAINQLHRFDPQPQDLGHAQKIVLGIQQAQIQNSPILDFNGGYYNPPRSTPAAVRTEGLIAAYHLFTAQGDTDFAKSILATIEKNLVFQLQTQVFPEHTLDFAKLNSGLGGFQKSVTDSEIRIDYVQHNLSGLLGYLKILEK